MLRTNVESAREARSWAGPAGAAAGIGRARVQGARARPGRGAASSQRRLEGIPSRRWAGGSGVG